MPSEALHAAKPRIPRPMHYESTAHSANKSTKRLNQGYSAMTTMRILLLATKGNWALQVALLTSLLCSAEGLLKPQPNDKRAHSSNLVRWQRPSA